LSFLLGGRRRRNETELDVVAELRKAGTPLPTDDEHFERIARVGSLVVSA
jgi:hypothetical protein